MIVVASIILLLLSPASCKPRYADVDDDGDGDDEHLLFKSAFDTATYEIDDYNDDMQLGKIDLLKDGMWAIKAKLKELKAFNKALAANVLLTNMKLKELLENQIVIKKHQHNILDKKNYNHKYQPQHYHLYEQPI